MIRHITYTLIALLTLAGCSANNEPALPTVDNNAAETYLKLSIASAEAPSGNSRANDYEFEGPINDLEKIQTMRFIIVDEAGYVEHNVLISQTDAPDVEIESAAYRVKPNETKTVFLIGNEASIPEEVLKPFKSLVFADGFPFDLAKTLTISRESATSPLYSNSQLIPMTEFHKVEIGAPKIIDGENVPYHEKLFVTRTAVKFTFNLNIVVKGNNPVDHIDVGDVTIHKIADKEFLFPVDTEYLPLKSPSTHENRIVTAYSTPADAATYSVPISWTQGSDIFHYTAGPVYLTETKYGEGNTPYSITLPIDGVDLTATLPNLPSLPRNTHVKVNITVTGPQIRCEVDLVPYIGVILEPDFGIDR